MFWHRKKSKDIFLLVFSVIALLIIIFTVLIIMIFLNKARQSDGGVGQHVQNYVDQTASILLNKNYADELKKLSKTIESGEADVFTTVEKVFFSVRVPEEMLDEHLQTFLQINALKEKKADNSEVLEALNNLLKKVEPNEEVYN